MAILCGAAAPLLFTLRAIVIRNAKDKFPVIALSIESLFWEYFTYTLGYFIYLAVY
jgi:hypothetical protein